MGYVALAEMVSVSSCSPFATPKLIAHMVLAGDCFYRCEYATAEVSTHILTHVIVFVFVALAFAYIENILNSSDTMLAATGALSVLEASQPQLESVGFQRLVFEDFYDCLASLINQVINPGPNGQLLNINSLLESFNNPEGMCQISS